MATFAVLNGSMVVNVIVADDQAEAQDALGVTLVEYTPDNPAGIGWTYDPASGLFTQPQPIPDGDPAE